MATAATRSACLQIMLDLFLSSTVNGTVRQARVPMRETAEQRAQREALNRRMLRGWVWRRGPIQRLALGSRASRAAAAASAAGVRAEDDAKEVEAILERAHTPQRLLTRRLLLPPKPSGLLHAPAGHSAADSQSTGEDEEEETALRAPEWLFGQYGGGSPADMVHPGPAFVAHLVGLEDKMAAMRLAGW